MVNKSLEQYLRAFSFDKPTRWAAWLTMAEFWFNTNFHTATKFIPFEALYGFPPPGMVDYILGTTRVEVVDTYLSHRVEVLKLLKQNLHVAQERMKLQADKHRVERSFAVGSWVYLRLQPYKQKSLDFKGFWKLSPRFYGPFRAIQQVGIVAYKLELPPKAKMLPISCVSCLKLKLGHNITPIPTLPPADCEGQLSPKLEAILQ